MMEKPQALTALQALAHEDRLEVMHLLVAHCKGDGGKAGMAAGDIGRQLGLAPSRLSFHLSALENAGLIGSEKVARNVIYRAQTGEIGALLGWLMRDCCHGHAHVLACCGAVPPDQGPDLGPDQFDAGSVNI